MPSVRDFGAVGDGITDDRAAIQAAIDAAQRGTVLEIPPGRYLAGQGAAHRCLSVPAGVTIHAPGAVLVQAPTADDSVRLLEVSGNGVTIDGLELDGQRGVQPTLDAQRHGIFATGAAALTIRNVTARNFTGDGFYLHAGSHRAEIDHCTAWDNGRNGITLGGGTIGTTIRDTACVGNAAQQIDSEMAVNMTVDGVTITGCTLDGLSVSGDYVLTVSGGSAGYQSRGWDVRNNVINGPVNVVWARDVRLRRNRGLNPTGKTCVRVFRACEDVEIDDNELTATAAPLGTGLVWVVGTAGGPPRRVRIARNRLVATGLTRAGGVRCEGAGSVIIEDNDLIGPRVEDAGVGVLLRATMVDHDFVSAVVRRNRVTSWGGAGLVLAGNGAAVMRLVDITDNIFDDNDSVMPAGMVLDDGSRCARDVRQSGNLVLGTCAVLVKRAPAGAQQGWGTGDRWVRS